MTQLIQIKRSITPGNVPATLDTGELAINLTDGSLFFGSATTVHNSFKFGGLDMGTGKITGLGDPTLAQDAATKAYVDSQTHTDGTVTGTGVDNRLAIWNDATGIDSDADFYVDADTLFARNLSTIGGIITGSDGNSSQWNDAYNNQVTAFAESGGSTTTLTLTQQDTGTLTTSFSNPQGTVESISSSTVGDALDVTVSNSTTTPAIALTWAGADTEYIDGAGNLTTFPSIPAGDVTAVDGGTYITTTDSTGPVPIVNHDATCRRCNKCYGNSTSCFIRRKYTSNLNTGSFYHSRWVFKFY